MPFKLTLLNGILCKADSQVQLGWAEVVVCASAVAPRLLELGIPEGVEVVVQDRTLSKGGVEMLGRMLRRLPQTSAQEV